MNYNWNWGIFWQISPDASHTYLQTLLLGTAWTPFMEQRFTEGRLFAIDTLSFDEAQGGFPQISATLVVDAFVYGTGTPATATPTTTTTSTSSTTTTATTTTTP